MINFDNQRVVITGAAGGVGGALISRFAACGAKVVACDVEPLEAGGHIAESHCFDLLDDVGMADTVGRILSSGPVAAVVSNAGWTRAERMDSVSGEALSREIDLNLRSAARFSQAFLPAMRARKSGVFVFVSSVNALSHYGNPAYSAAKAGLLAWMRALATEEGRNGIRANAIAPGSIRTPAWDHRIERDPAIMDKIARLYPIGRMVDPVEVANAALFLASPLAGGITGVTLAVDGGLSAGNLPFLENIVA